MKGMHKPTNVLIRRETSVIVEIFQSSLYVSFIWRSLHFSVRVFLFFVLYILWCFPFHMVSLVGFRCVYRLNLEPKNYSHFVDEHKIPNDWPQGIQYHYVKQRDRKKCENYKWITLLSQPFKIYEQILNGKLKIEIKTKQEEQYAFRKKLGISQNI